MKGTDHWSEVFRKNAEVEFPVGRMWKRPTETEEETMLPVGVVRT